MCGVDITGITICLTGTNDSITRHEAEELISRYGGKPTHVITGKTDYLLYGEHGMYHIIQYIDIHLLFDTNTVI